MVNINPSYLHELRTHHLPDKDLRKQAKFLLKCKEVIWNDGLLSTSEVFESNTEEQEGNKHLTLASEVLLSLETKAKTGTIGNWQ